MSSPSAPKLFAGKSAKTPKHDNMLLLMAKDSDFFKVTINQIIGRELDRINAEIKPCYIDKEETQDIAIFKQNGKEFATLEWKIKEYNGRYYYIRNFDAFNEHKYGWEYCIDELIKEGVIEEIDEVQYKKCKKIFAFTDIEVIDWIPEDAITNNGYYIGSVDLNVGVMIKYSIDIVIRNDWIWNFDEISIPCRIIFEFKPDIGSFSETLRQVNVYRKYKYHLLHEPKKIYKPERIVYSKKEKYCSDTKFCFCVLTYSDIGEFKEIFESQGIHIFNVDDLIKQTKKEDIKLKDFEKT